MFFSIKYNVGKAYAIEKLVLRDIHGHYDMSMCSLKLIPVRRPNYLALVSKPRNTAECMADKSSEKSIKKENSASFVK
jgi:hypothetical protein